jgi:hypothetical protein
MFAQYLTRVAAPVAFAAAFLLASPAWAQHRPGHVGSVPHVSPGRTYHPPAVHSHGNGTWTNHAWTGHPSHNHGYYPYHGYRGYTYHNRPYYYGGGGYYPYSSGTYGYSGYYNYPYYDYGYYPDYYDYGTYPYAANTYIPPAYETVQGPSVTPTYGSPPAVAPNQALIVVDVPVPQAQVWFNNVPVQQNSIAQAYITPVLSPGVRYTYDIRARWIDFGGSVVDQTRPLAVLGGNQVTVDFRQPY